MRNYAGHRSAPWLSHLMVSRSETARPLLTPGEVVMQFTPDDGIVMVADIPPIPAEEARYFEDARFRDRLLPVPENPNAGVAGIDDGRCAFAFLIQYRMTHLGPAAMRSNSSPCS